MQTNNRRKSVGNRNPETFEQSSKSELLENVSHELTTPLASIKDFIESLIETDVKLSQEEQMAFLRSADQETDRLMS